MPDRLAVRALTKTFGSARVLTDVELTVRPGEVHGLAGQNGSGKSTLIKIVTGLYTPGPGAGFEVDGQPVRLPVRWPEVHAAGISVVHQDLGLLDQLTVAENICIGGYPTTRLGRIDRHRRDELAARTLDRLGVPLTPSQLVGTLTAAQRAEVAIARAMRDHTPGSGLIILDESTRALSGADLEHVHQLLRRIAADGSSALMVSHSLPELIAVADRITVLRDGRVVGAGLPTAGLSEQELARRMLGSTVEAVAPRENPSATQATPAANTAAVTVTGLAGPQLTEVSFEVAPGEILGITGLLGSGRTELALSLFGMSPADSGEIRMHGKPLALRSNREAIDNGIAYVSEDRLSLGLVMEQPISSNIALTVLEGLSDRFGLVETDRRQQTVRRWIGDLGIKVGDPENPVGTLSGGNQQRVVLAKWLATRPSLLILDSPTVGVDIGAKDGIYRIVRDLAESGIAIIMISDEIPEVYCHAHRVLVMREGRIVGEYRPLETTEASLREAVDA